METFRIYLAGKCKDLSFEESDSWRKVIKKILEEVHSDYKVKVFNPNDYFNYYEKLHKTNKQIKEFFFSRLDKCNLVIVNLNNSNSSVGTGQELQRASDMGIPIIGFGTEEVYPWESEVDCQVVFNTMDECIKYAIDYYLL